MKIRDWARSAQVNPQDMLSNDKTIWTKAPMIPEMEMDWLVVVDERLFYGPTTAEALLEFSQLGEISPETPLVNCCKGEATTLSATAFYQAAQLEPKEEKILSNSVPAMLQQPGQGGLRENLQKRIRELEVGLLEKRRKLMTAEETIVRLQGKIKELEDRVRDISGFRKG
ncbi:MAG: hypothetical protein WCQ57_11175 [Verrucomicrobiota bacterium]